MARREYIVLVERPIEQLPIDIACQTRIRIGEYSFPGGCTRYKNFLNSPDKKCVTCGIQCTFFRLEYQTTNGKCCKHINFYGYSPSGSVVMLTQDHIIPKSRGGKSTLDNLQLMCARCNSHKSNFLPGEVWPIKGPKTQRISLHGMTNFRKATKEILKNNLCINKTPLFICENDAIISWHRGQGNIVAAIPRLSELKVKGAIVEKRQITIEYQDKEYAVDYQYVGVK